MSSIRRVIAGYFRNSNPLSGRNQGRFRLALNLLPLNRAGRFRCDVIGNAVDAFDLVDDTGRGFA